MPIRSVAIVGAGLAGLACARTLAAHGIAARLLDKGRAPGGRLATRRVEVDGPVLAFDHGAPCVSAEGALFRAMLDAVDARPWIEAGMRVGVPRMSAIPRALAEGLELTLGREVLEIGGAPGAWRLRHASPRRPGGAPGADVVEEGPYEAVLLALPAPQAAALLEGPAPHLRQTADLARMAPCWTLMAAFPVRLDLPDQVSADRGAIARAVRDSSKPGRDPATECWVVQAAPAWSRDHLELSPAEACAALLREFARLAEQELPPLIHAAAHRWRFAQVEAPLGAPCLWDPAQAIGASGDWCLGGLAEAAAESGTALGAAVARA